MEPFHIAEEPSGALCARKNARLIANLSQISYLCIYYHCPAAQKRPNWGIKHNKSQNSRANFSANRRDVALWCASRNVCLQSSWGKARFGMVRLPASVSGIRANYFRELYPLSLSQQPPQHVFKLCSSIFLPTMCNL